MTRDPQRVFRHLVGSGPETPSPQDELTEPEAPSWPPSGRCLTKILLIVHATFQVPDVIWTSITRITPSVWITGSGLYRVPSRARTCGSHSTVNPDSAT